MIHHHVSIDGVEMTTLVVTGNTVRTGAAQVYVGELGGSATVYATADQANQIAEAWRLAAEQIRANEITARLTTEAVTA